jgi:hypothetical protein
MKTQQTMNAPEMYEIRVAGHLSTNWAARFEGLSMRHQPEGETVLSGLLDQAALHGVLARIRDLGLKLISVRRIEEDNSSHSVDRNWRQS